MSEVQEPARERDDIWTDRHRQTVALMEKALSGVLILAGLVISVLTDGIAQWVGVGVLVTGVFVFFPVTRPILWPLLSKFADKVKFLPSKTDE